jgi:hypothetical protein
LLVDQTVAVVVDAIIACRCTHGCRERAIRTVVPEILSTARCRGIEAFAGITNAVTVRVNLIVGHRWAVVTNVACSITIRIDLIGIGHHRAVVKRINPAITVGIGSFTGIAYVVRVCVSLVDVRDEWAVVTGITDAVQVAVGLVVRDG